MEKLCDLHTHSTFSDGTNTPEELIDLAVKTGLSAVALTDHNTVSGLDRFTAYGKDRPVDIVPGVEISTDHKGNELHILGLFLTPDMFGRINDYLTLASERKEKSNILLIERLNKSGYKIDYDELKAAAPSGRINRANVANELLKKGYIESVKSAFSTILSPEYGFYEPPERLSALETVAFLESVGAVSVWAHPLFSVDKELCEEFLAEAQKCGLSGMETVYSTYDEADIKLSKELCARFGLHESGGSDFHGATKPTTLLGHGENNISVPYEFYIGLKSVSAKQSVAYIKKK